MIFWRADSVYQLYQRLYYNYVMVNCNIRNSLKSKLFGWFEIGFVQRFKIKLLVFNLLDGIHVTYTDGGNSGMILEVFMFI